MAALKPRGIEHAHVGSQEWYRLWWTCYSNWTPKKDTVIKYLIMCSAIFLTSISRDDEEDTLLIQERGENTKMSNNTEFPFKQRSYHIRRAFDLYGNIHSIINDGIKRQAREELGDDTIGIQ